MSSNVKYIGLDLHKEAISIAVLNGAGILVMESIIETKAVTLLQFLQGLRGELHMTLEEGTWAAWLYDVLQPHVHESTQSPLSRLGHSLCEYAVYAPRYREEWLNKIRQAGVRRRAELFYQHLDGLQVLRRLVRGEFLAESRKHQAVKLLRQIPCIGPVRAALLTAIVDLQWSRGGDARQRATLLCGRTVATFQEAPANPWSQ